MTFDQIRRPQDEQRDMFAVLESLGLENSDQKSIVFQYLAMFLDFINGMDAGLDPAPVAGWRYNYLRAMDAVFNNDKEKTYQIAEKIEEGVALIPNYRRM